MDKTLPATVRTCCLQSWMTVSCCPQLVVKKGAVAEKEHVAAHWAVAELTKEVDGPAEEQADLVAVENGFVGKKAEHCCLCIPILLGATMSLNIHQRDQRHKSYYGCHDVTQTGAASGATSAAAASVGGVALVKLTSTRRMGPPSRRISAPDRRVRLHQADYEV